MSGEGDAVKPNNLILEKNPKVVLEAMRKDIGVMKFADPSLFTDAVFRDQIIEILKDALVEKVEIFFESFWLDEDINYEIMKDTTYAMNIFFKKVDECGKFDKTVDIDKLTEESLAINESYLDLETLYQKDEMKWPIEERSRAKVERIFDGYSLIIELIDRNNQLTKQVDKSK